MSIGLQISLISALATLTGISPVVHSEPINCGLQKVKVDNGKVVWIQHEDGSAQSGIGVSSNWTYDGRSIKHRLMDEGIPCGTKEKTREEVIKELSSRFAEKPSLYSLTKAEGTWMAEYTAKLMRSDSSCH
jgi:hypothetical protein